MGRIAIDKGLYRNLCFCTVRRQIEGFDEDYKQKILKIMMDAWSVGFSVAKDSFEASGVPATMQKAAIDDLYNDYIRKDFDAYKYKRDSEMIES